MAWPLDCIIIDLCLVAGTSLRTKHVPMAGSVYHQCGDRIGMDIPLPAQRTASSEVGQRIMFNQFMYTNTDFDDIDYAIEAGRYFLQVWLYATAGLPIT